MALSIATLALEALLGLFTVFVVYAQATKMPAVVKPREKLHYPQWYWNLATVLATIGAVGLLVGLFVPLVGAAAALWMTAYFAVAALTHLSRGDVQGSVMGLMSLVITVGLVVLRWADVAALLKLVGL
jgi:DoxX-like family